MSLRHNMAIAASAAALTAPLVGQNVAEARPIDTTTLRVGETGNPEGERGSFQDCAREALTGANVYVDGRQISKTTGKYVLKLNAQPVEVVGSEDESNESQYCEGVRRISTKIKVGKKAVGKLTAIGNALVSYEDGRALPLKYVKNRVKVSAETTITYTEDGVTARRKKPTECLIFYRNGDGSSGMSPGCSAKTPSSKKRPEPPITTEG